MHHSCNKNITQKKQIYQRISKLLISRPTFKDVSPAKSLKHAQYFRSGSISNQSANTSPK